MQIREIIADLGQPDEQGQYSLDPQILNPPQPVRRGERQHQSVLASPQFQAWFQGSRIVDKQGNPLRVYHGTQAPEDFHQFAAGDSVSTEDDEYHRTGSGADPRTFLGSHFAKEPQVASKFAMGLYGERQDNREGGRVMPVYLKITNPLTTSDSAMYETMLRGSYVADAVTWALDEMAERQNEDPDELGEMYENKPGFRAEINDYALNNYDSEEPDFSLAEEMAADYRAKLMQHGYDGIIYRNEIEGGTSYIVFDPHQVKSAMNTGTFNPKSPHISESTFI